MGMLHKAVVVGTRHGNVDVVVPRYEPLMSDSTQEGSCCQIVGELMGAAHSVYLYEDVENAQL